MAKGERITDILRKRMKFYILGYLMGLFGPIITQIKYKDFVFFPITLLAVICAVLIGTAAYYGSIKMPIFAGTFRALKYLLPMIGVVIIASIIETYLMKNYGINIKPYIGF